MAAVEKLKIVSLCERPPLLLVVMVERFSAGSSLIEAVGVDGAGESRYDEGLSCLPNVFGLWGIVLKAPPVGWNGETPTGFFGLLYA